MTCSPAQGHANLFCLGYFSAWYIFKELFNFYFLNLTALKGNVPPPLSYGTLVLNRLQIAVFGSPVQCRVSQWEQCWHLGLDQALV